MALSLTGVVLRFSLPVSVRTWNAGSDVGLDPREMGLVARDLLGLSLGRGESPVLIGRDKASGRSTILVGEEDDDEIVSLAGGGALGRLA